MLNETLALLPFQTVTIVQYDYTITGILGMIILFSVMIYFQMLETGKKGRIWYHLGNDKWQELEFEKKELLNKIPLIKTSVGYWDISGCTLGEVVINIFSIPISQPLLKLDKNINTPLQFEDIQKR